MDEEFEDVLDRFLDAGRIRQLVILFLYPEYRAELRVAEKVRRIGRLRELSPAAQEKGLYTLLRRCEEKQSQAA